MILGYVALSTLWIEGLQRDEYYHELQSREFDAVFTLLKDKHSNVVVWTDVLINHGGDPATTSLEDETLPTDIINAPPFAYTRADAVIILDALVLKLTLKDLTDV